MTLRARLFLVLAATAVPMTAAAAWLRGELERRGMEEGLRGLMVARMEGGGRERCEASPETFSDPPFPGGRPPGPGRGPRGPGGPGGFGEAGGPGGPEGPEDPGRAGGDPDLPDRRARRGRARSLPPPLEMFAYGPDFRSANPRAPEFPAALREALSAGKEVASTPWSPGEQRRGIQVAARMEWDEGPCAVVLARRAGPARAGGRPPVPWETLALGGVMAVAVLLAAGPLVRRVRRLTGAVRRSAADRYAVPVRVEGNDEIAGLARAFNEAGEEVRGHLEALEERERTLRAFVADTTHDVLIPLTVLQGHLADLRKQVEGGVPVERDLVLDAVDEAHYMASLVQNLGLAARLEAGAPGLQRHPVDLNALVGRAAGRHRPVARQRGIALEFAVPEETLVYEGDPTMLEQAVSNVVHNAVRHNREGGHVAVTLEGRPPAGWSLRVVDDGPGIPPDEIARLTERRFRGREARTRDPAGSGLGLHIARTVAERHGLALEFRPRPGGGLEVEFHP